MNGHRTCIICSPRSGSQLCERLISEVQSAFILGEYFENWNQTVYNLDIKNNIISAEFKRIPSKLSLADNIDDRLNLLSSINSEQALVVRIFLMDDYDKVAFSAILNFLKNIGFEFITITRELKEQVLSFMIALSYKVYKNKNVFGINSIINEPVYVNLELLDSIFDNLINTCYNWDTNLKLVSEHIRYCVVNFNSLNDDLEKIYKIKFSYQGRKSINDSPMNLISNQEDVIQYLLAKNIK